MLRAVKPNAAKWECGSLIPRFWAETLVKLHREHFERVISLPSANVLHHHYPKSVPRLQQNISYVHLVRTTVKQKRLTRERNRHRDPTEPVAAERGRARRSIRSWRHLDHRGMQLPECVRLDQRRTTIAAGRV